jgi:hypothetical protein
VLDLSSLRSLQIDVEGRKAWVDAGVTAGDYTTATGEHGLATGFGDAPSVGVTGITLGGGVGFLHRKYGLTIDHLLAAEVVTADGRVLLTNPETHPDLFWALRGGGGNFGVVTRLHFRLHPVDTVLGGMLVLPATPDGVASFLEACLEAPDELSGVINVMPAPPMPFLAPEQHGQPIILAILVHCGDPEAAERDFASLRMIAPPLSDMIHSMRYPAVYDGHDQMPHPAAVAIRSGFLDSLDRPAIQQIIEGLRNSTAPMRVAQFRVLGGAVARVPAGATAFAHRDRRIMLNVGAAYDRLEEADEHQAWASGLARAIQSGDGGAYVGFLGDEGEDRVREAYPGTTWDRLRRVKARYDPTNLFRLNQNIPPDGFGSVDRPGGS